MNAFPDFGQTGERLGSRVVGGLMREVGRVVGRWVLGDTEKGNEEEKGGKDNGEGHENEGRGRLVKLGSVNFGL